MFSNLCDNIAILLDLPVYLTAGINNNNYSIDRKRTAFLFAVLMIRVSRDWDERAEIVF